MAMTKEAQEARRAYKREWNRKNKDKCRAYMEKYWQKKANEAQNAVPESDQAAASPIVKP